MFIPIALILLVLACWTHHWAFVVCNPGERKGENIIWYFTFVKEVCTYKDQSKQMIYILFWKSFEVDSSLAVIKKLNGNLRCFWGGSCPQKHSLPHSTPEKEKPAREHILRLKHGDWTLEEVKLAHELILNKVYLNNLEWVASFGSLAFVSLV